MAKKVVSPAPQASGWLGWIYFASAMLVLVGGLQAIAGLTGIFNDNFYVVTDNQLIVLNTTAWGWIHLAIGILLVGTGIALAVGKMWARVVALFVAVLSALANIAWLPVYPIWSIIALVVDGLVIYAVATHGGDLEEK
ncbi:MAG: hypothetical protein WBP26_01395 [Candidatus Saccharimonadales bacterium]